MKKKPAIILTLVLMAVMIMLPSVVYADDAAVDAAEISVEEDTGGGGGEDPGAGTPPVDVPEEGEPKPEPEPEPAPEPEPEPEVAVDAVGFPDTFFRNYVSSKFDKNYNGSLDKKEISAVKEIDVSDLSVRDLTGIQYFTALKELICSDNDLKTLDVSQNTELTDLDCGNNALTSLDVSANPKLVTLYCSRNQLTQLDIGRNTKLTELLCEQNQLAALDLGANTALQNLDCSGNQLTALDLSSNTKLWSLDCSGNQLSSLNFTNNKLLWRIVCRYNQLTWLSVTGLNSLTFLDCRDNAFTAITQTTGWSSRLREGDSFLFYPQPNITVPNLRDDLIEVTLSETTYDYNGKNRKPAVTVTYNGEPQQTLQMGVHYTVTYSENKNPGIAAVQIKAIWGNGYAGSRTEYFTIQPDRPKLVSIANKAKGISIKWKTVKKATSYMIYRKTEDGKYEEVGEKFCYNSKTKELSYTDKKVKKNNGELYTYTVCAVAGNGTYGNAEGEYKKAGLELFRLIRPKLSRVKNSSKSAMELTWKENPEANGYELRYADNSSFKNNRTIKIKGSDTLSKKISGLTKGKRYYVRIRTWINAYGTKNYSAWSPTKSLKIQK